MNRKKSNTLEFDTLRSKNIVMQGPEEYAGYSPIPVLTMFNSDRRLEWYDVMSQDLAN